ncbi:MAG: cysteine dioxygenase family protein [Flavobacteriales bacterium]|nr:cysteine dioxygenase family protein [Flavobacteriales bacterium]
MVSQTIDTLEQLVHNLNMGPGYEGYRSLVEAINLDPAELIKFCDAKCEDHQRICIYDTPGIEAVLSYWKPGQSTRIHDYNFQQAWTKVIKGQLILEFFDVFDGEPNAEITETQLMDPGDIIYMNTSFGFHRYANLSAGDAIAIHIYADKIDAWHIYDEDTGSIETVPTAYSRVL